MIPALPSGVCLRRFGVAAAFAAFLLPGAVRGQGGAASGAAQTTRIPFIPVPRIVWTPPAAFRPLGRAVLRGRPSAEVAAAAADAFRRRLQGTDRALWLASVERSRRAQLLGAEVAAAGARAPGDSLLRAPADTGIAALLSQLVGDGSTIGIQLHGRFESKIDRTRNERCTAGQYFAINSQCSASFQPAFDFQLATRAGGTVANRLHVNVDYDTQREFDASNNINFYYTGKSDEMLERLEVGNITLQLPATQFITSGIPQGNFGIQALGQLGPAKFRTIVATQRGNIPKTFDVTVGDKTLQTNTQELEDYRVVTGRFFFTVDPLLFGSSYPNIDILNATQMRLLAQSLPETVRPQHISVYRLHIGGQPSNPNGPRFQIIGDPNSRAGQVYDLLRENQDYYTDQSLLWIALASPLNTQTDRLVIAYTLRIGGRDTVIAELGGTPDVEFTPDHPQFAHLLWDPQIKPTDAAFRQQIRSAYLVASEDLQRGSVSVRVVTGNGAGQEKPLAGVAQTYLQMFGLSQSGNASTFDVDNRLWPRQGDPNVAVGSAANAKIIRDYFIILPSAHPFGRDGLVTAGNPASDTVYTTPNEDLYSPLHPQANYRFLLQYDLLSGSDVSNVSIGAVQLRRFSEVVTIDGIPLRRDIDYTMDYELGRITFTRADTLFPPQHPRHLSVRYEENPQFVAAPTSLWGVSSQIPMERGQLGFTVLSRSQTTSFTRPPLGYEPQSSLVAGVTGNFTFDAAPLSHLLEKIPAVGTTTLSHVDVQAEFATSRPQPNSAGQAYIESFEGEGGIQIGLAEAAWRLSSQAALGARLPQRLGASTFDLIRATTLAWQNGGTNTAGVPIQFTMSQIDPQIALTGTGVSAPEQLLWMTLYPLNTGGLFNDRTKKYQWRVDDAPLGRRWRSIVTSLGPSGQDLSRVEYSSFGRSSTRRSRAARRTRR